MNNRNSIRRCIAVLLMAAMALGLMALSACAEPDTYAEDARPSWYDYMVLFPGGDTWFYVSNRLIIARNRETGASTLDILPIAAERGWRVLSRSGVSVMVELSTTHTWYELEAIGEQLTADYPELIRRVFLVEGGGRTENTIDIGRQRFTRQ